MDLYSIIMLFIFILILFIISVVCFIMLTSVHYPRIEEYTEESTFLDSYTKKQTKFPSLADRPTLTLSVVVPAYNEEDRLPPMLDECVSYLEEKSKNEKFTYEILLVDDGSKDKTSQVGLKYSEKLSSSKIRVLTLCKNRGKGGAVRLGMLRARGEFILFADADGATKFSDFSKIEASMMQLTSDEKERCETLGIVCGSRAHLESDSVATRSFIRTILMYGFHFLVWFLTVKNVKDTQCGFKLLTRRTARIIFNSLHIERWAFDVEMLYMAQMLGIPINEVAVTWTEIEGSKVTPVISWIQMGFDLFCIWFRYRIGAWRIKGDLLT